MAISNQVCCRCNKEFKYDSDADEKNDPVIPLKMTKVVEDKDKNMVKFFEIPKDKQNIVNPIFIKYCCGRCLDT